MDSDLPGPPGADDATPVPPDPVELPRVVSRPDALGAGLTRDQIRQRVRSGRWSRLKSGVYARSAPEAPDEFARERQAHVDRCIAAVRSHSGARIGFASAAVALGLPLVTGVPTLGQVITPDGGWTGIRDGIRYRAATCPPDDTVYLDPNGSGVAVPVTSAARTIVDVARTMTRPDAVAVGDAALRMGLATRGDAEAILARMRHVRGCRTARDVVAFWDARRETALESWSAHRFWEWGLPCPVPQVSFFDEEGFIGRVDFFWEDFGIVGEADGRLKYLDGDALYAEKRREDRLRRQARGVVRWGWEDLRAPRDAVLRRRLERILR